MKYHAINCPHRPNSLNARAALDALVAQANTGNPAWDDPEVWAQKLSECQAALEEMRRERDEYREQWADVSSVEFLDYWQTIGYTCSAGTAIKALLARAQRYEEALHAIADEGQYMHEDRWHREAALIASLALTEEHNTVGGGQIGC